MNLYNLIAVCIHDTLPNRLVCGKTIRKTGSEKTETNTRS